MYFVISFIFFDVYYIFQYIYFFKKFWLLPLLDELSNRFKFDANGGIPLLNEGRVIIGIDKVLFVYLQLIILK